MPILMRAPSEVGAWLWYVETSENSYIEDSFLITSKVSSILENHHLLKPAVVEVCWYQRGEGKIGIWTRASSSFLFSVSRYEDFISQIRPAGFPDAYVAHIEKVGMGVWIDTNERRRQEPQLINLTVSPEPDEIQVEIRVHHDIWSRYDFSGHPHSEVYERNAPRLAAALEEVERTLQVETENGEGTYFGVSEGFWIKDPDPEDLVSGLAMNATDGL